MAHDPVELKNIVAILVVYAGDIHDFFKVGRPCYNQQCARILRRTDVADGSLWFDVYDGENVIKTCNSRFVVRVDY